MSKPEWGTKRTCQGCSAKFYDLNRSPIVCPKCDKIFDPEALLKSRPRRSASATNVAAVSAGDTKVGNKNAPAADSPDLPESDESDDVLVVVDDDDDENSAIEDPSELGEDDDDVADVIVPSDNENER